MDQRPITAQEFTKRLTQLCLSGRSDKLPRKQRDRQIILKSIVLCLSKDGSYSEQEINASLENWVSAIGRFLEVDHAGLRRTLVDEKYLERTGGGAVYRLVPASGADWFSGDVDQINPTHVIQETILEAAAKREQFRNRT